MRLRIGITGGIGSGKSTVSHIFSVLGIPVWDADTAARTIMETQEGLINAIRSAFGEASYLDGKLNRKFLADQVFHDPAKLEQLNALVHPFAIAEAAAWSEKQDTPYTVKEAALFFESGSAGDMDYIIGVYAPRHIRIQRVMDRDGLSREAVLERMQRQIQEEIKMRLCDFVILNDDQHLLIPQVLKLHEQFLAESQETHAAIIHSAGI
ncbi:MAG TPA: dephospho-CoA kinase [Sediminibacterium sp.]|nr:dephospho-CoA kinase [Sediminibacterium sp.]